MDLRNPGEPGNMNPEGRGWHLTEKRERRSMALRRFLFAAVLLGLSALPLLLQAQLPESKGAPAVGEKAPDFTLPDTDGKPVTLSGLLAGAGTTGKPVNGVLLIFYRGYW
jgi:hypothetical protein